MSIQNISLFGYPANMHSPSVNQSFGGRKGAQEVNPFVSSPIGSFASQRNNVNSDSLVSRLDKMDASILKPEHQCPERANKLDVFA